MESDAGRDGGAAALSSASTSDDATFTTFGLPLMRGAKIVPVENDLPPRVLTKRVFGHVTPVLHRLADFYARTVQRWEILRARDVRRSEAAGVKCDMPELPAVDKADKKEMH